MESVLVFPPPGCPRAHGLPFWLFVQSIPAPQDAASIQEPLGVETLFSDWLLPTLLSAGWLLPVRPTDSQQATASCGQTGGGEF